MNRWTCCLGWSLAFAFVARGQDLPSFPPSTNVRVLCVGVNGYEKDCVAKQPGGAEIKVFADLHHAEADAEAMRAILKGKFGYCVRVLIGENATRERILEELTWLEGAGKDGAAIFYFSGHGTTAVAEQATPSGRGAFMIPAGSGLAAEVPPGLPADKPEAAVAAGARVPSRKDALTTKALETRTLAVEDVRRRLKVADVRHSVVIVDACCAGFELDGADVPAVRAKGDGGNDTRYTVFNKPSACVMTAGTDVQQTFEGLNSETDRANPYLADAAGHGWYSAELIHRLNKVPVGEGVTTFELYSDLQRAVHSRAGGPNSATEIVPQYRGRGDGMFVWVPNPTEPWLRSVAEDIQSHDRVVRGTNKGEAQGPTKGPARSQPGSAAAQKGPAGATGKAGGPRSLAQQLEEAASELDLLVVAVKAGEMRGNRQANPIQFDKDPRWQEWRQRCVLNASAGDPKAMTALYYAFESGICVPKNAATAKSWLQEGLDGNDTTAASVFTYTYHEATKPPTHEPDKEKVQAATALTGAILAVEGARQGNAGAAAVGIGLTVLALSASMKEPGVKDVIQRAVASRAALTAELGSITGPNKANVQKALGSFRALAQQIENLAKNDVGEAISPFKRLGESVASQLKQEVERVDREGMARLPEFDRRLDELLALYTARCAVIQEAAAKEAGGKPGNR